MTFCKREDRISDAAFLYLYAEFLSEYTENTITR